MRIYVLGKGEEIHNIRKLMAALEKAGHVITYDWTVKYKELYGNKKKVQADDFTIDETVRDCISAINDANVVIGYTWHELPYKGAYCELGIAIVFGKPVFLLGHGMDGCDFAHHSQVRHVVNNAQLLKTLKEM